MPNWCKNKLSVKGDSFRVVRFIAKACGPYQHYKPTQYDLQCDEHKKMYNVTLTPDEIVAKKENDSAVLFSYHSLYPIPDDIMEEAYDPFGYDTEHLQWGIKWGASDAILVSYQDGIANYEFTTPYSPGKPFFEKVAKDWRSLTFALSYSEEYPSRGRWLIKNGAFVEEINETPSGKHSYGWRNKYLREHNKWIKEALK